MLVEIFSNLYIILKIFNNFLLFTQKGIFFVNFKIFENFLYYRNLIKDTALTNIRFLYWLVTPITKIIYWHKIEETHSIR